MVRRFGSSVPSYDVRLSLCFRYREASRSRFNAFAGQLAMRQIYVLALDVWCEDQIAIYPKALQTERC